MSVYTVDRLSDHELVAVVLGMKADDEAVGLIATAMTSEGWVSGCTLSQLAREYGSVGPRRLARLEASVELGRRALKASTTRRNPVISTPEQAVEILRPLLSGRNREHFVALALSTKNSLLRVAEVSVGSLNASIVHPRELFREAVAVSAATVVVAHCHPSGDPTPSGADIQLTRRLVKAGDVIGIEVLDHIVVGGDRFESMRELGLM